MITQEYVEQMHNDVQEYGKLLHSLPPEEARQLAKENLIAMGVLDKNGNPKKQIVTGDFFGW